MMGFSASFKKLNLDIENFDKIFSDHSIITITDLNGVIVYMNDKFCELSKYSEDELIGQNHRILKSDEHSDEFFTTMWDTITSGQIWKGEIKNRAKDGSYYWLKSTIIPVTDSKDNVTHFIAIRTDITKEKEIESKLLKTEAKLVKQNEDLTSQVEIKSSNLVRSERLATIGTMASRIAHDLKNPLTLLHTYAEMLSPEILSKLDSKDKEKWFRMQNSIFDMNRIIEDVLDFARTTEIKKKPAYIQRILKLAMNHVKSSYGVTINLSEKDLKINCDERKIEGVLSNIINNAVQAIDGTGEIDVEIESDSEFLNILIKDSGPGISDENLSKIFEPMFTTKTTGTGLGLVICKSIVEQHGGSISVSNKPTTFTIRLPL
ncbi:MAG: two-component system sensor histidine kinase NtrB [Candidatus Nitrosopumilus sp. bin_32a]